MFNNRTPVTIAFAFTAAFLAVIVLFADKEKQMEFKYNKLSPAQARVILKKETEMPYSGKFVNHKVDGYYTCMQCDAPLFLSDNKFDSRCGWPSFDLTVPGAVKKSPDPDGLRTEISCARCRGHLGHVFTGEGFTSRNVRHCVNSISLNFVAKKETERAIFASGCFWGTEYHFKRLRGVLETTAGYTGGSSKSPAYSQVSQGSTGHAEAVEVIFNPRTVSYESLVKLFFETHDPGQLNRQGPDVGEQYRSEIFYLTEEQKKIATALARELQSRGFQVVTKITRADAFWPAEDYHQDYYQRKNTTPYCHVYRKKF